MKATADRRWEELLREKELGSIEELPSRLTFRRQVIIEKFQAESDEIKEEVEKFRHSDPVNDDGDFSGDEDGEGIEAEVREQMAKAKAYQT